MVVLAEILYFRFSVKGRRLSAVLLCRKLLWFEGKSASFPRVWALFWFSGRNSFFFFCKCCFKQLHRGTEYSLERLCYLRASLLFSPLFLFFFIRVSLFPLFPIRRFLALLLSGNKKMKWGRTGLHLRTRPDPRRTKVGKESETRRGQFIPNRMWKSLGEKQPIWG